MLLLMLRRVYDVMVVRLSAEDIKGINFVEYSYADDLFYVVSLD